MGGGGTEFQANWKKSYHRDFRNSYKAEMLRQAWSFMPVTCNHTVLGRLRDHLFY